MTEKRRGRLGARGAPGRGAAGRQPAGWDADETQGSLHPVMVIHHPAARVSPPRLYRLRSAPEIDIDFYNFSALKFSDHPARDMQDTFFHQQPGKKPF